MKRHPVWETITSKILFARVLIFGRKPGSTGSDAHYSSCPENV